MNNLKKIANRNGIQVKTRRYSLASLISESYQTLYKCELDSPIYKLTESLIESIQEDPTNTAEHSTDLDTLKELVAMGDEADVSEEDLAPEEEVDASEEALEEEDEEIPAEEELPTPDAEEEIPVEEDDDMAAEEMGDPEEELTPEELDELCSHLKKMRERKRESAKVKVKESASWSTESSAMSSALKNFRESSNKKAFFKSLNKLTPRLQEGATPLTPAESISLYKSTNSAMTHLAVELEHNPEFIYTFRECTSILSKDNDALLNCISNHKTPSKSLVESFRKFASILLESEEVDEVPEEEDELNSKMEEGDGVNLPKEDDADVINEDQEKELEKHDDADVIDENQEKELEKKDDADVIDENDEKHLEKEDSEDLLEDEEPLEEPGDEESISDEEAAELRKYLDEMRKARKK